MEKTKINKKSPRLDHLKKYVLGRSVANHSIVGGWHFAF